ncbi:MAG: hypothetical protein ACSHXZ_10030 [Gammaproteobacteria bacterium]
MTIKSILFLGIVSIATVTSFAAESPEYSTGKLLLPAVDADGKPGFFQDVVIEAAGENLWRVSELYEGIPIKQIGQVELIKSSSMPVQVFLKISGSITGCNGFGRVSTVLGGSAFNLIAYYEVDKLPPGEIVCGQSLTPYSETIPLPVYGLDAGTYSYDVNGEFSGTFTLDSKNTL